ncbi:MAG: polysaccharide biosynthesis/export family protein [Bacteroidetes bacterium]|nr:polysaccharide biosynthesis/export family protein [Bacteroidota bacterium]
MKQTLNLLTKIAFLLLGITLVFSSCVPQKKILYLQKQQEKDTASIYAHKHPPDYRIQPRDNVYIKLFTLDEKSNLYFNKQSGTSGSYNDYANDASIYLNSYSVSPDGYIDFPVVGKIMIKDLTVSQVKDVLQKLVDEYLKETVVVVKMVNFKITILGEVNHPGEFTIYADKINFFEAISLANDLTDFGNRNKVVLIRQVPGGSRVYKLNMTSDTFLKSDQFYLQPNDIIYVQPLAYKRWGFGSTFPWAIVLAGISAGLLLITYMKTL